MDESRQSSGLSRILEVFWIALRLGLTSFGGPIAHLGYFHAEYVQRRKWLDERSYADLVALCQFLPGPASSQVGIGIGIIRAGLMGGIVAWLGFTFPSVIALILFAFAIQGLDMTSSGLIHGLKIVAVAIVAQAVWSMGKNLVPDRNRATIAILTIICTLLWPSALMHVLVIVVAAIIGFLLYQEANTEQLPKLGVLVSKRIAISCLALFFSLLILLPILRQVCSSTWLAMFDSFYRTGSLVFGGGHVVLPLLEREVVPVGWIDAQTFLTGYGAAQAVPGPLFTFAAFLGAMMEGWLGALVATIAIFLPAFLLVIGTLPFWDVLRRKAKVQGALTGVNAAVVGILAAALYQPIWTTTIHNVYDFSLGILLFGLLVCWKVSPWIVVILGALGGMLITG